MAQATIIPTGQKLDSFSLLSGHSIPALGLGTWKSAAQASDSVFTAITQAGYRHIDTAMQYAVQEDVGHGPKSNLQCKQGLIGKISLSLPSYDRCTDLSPDRVRIAFNNTLQQLQLDYLDLYLIHWPFHLKEGASRPPKAGDLLEFDLEGVWGQMEELVKDNLVRDIGVCNFTIKKLNHLLGFARVPGSMRILWSLAGKSPHLDFQALSTIPDQRRVLDGEELFVNQNEGPSEV